MEFLDTVYYGNTARQYLIAAATFALALAAFSLARRLLVGRLRWLSQKTDTKWDDLFVDLLEMIKNPECYLVAFYAATRPLLLPLWLDKGFRAAVVIAITFRIATMVQRAGAFAVTEGLLRGREKDVTFLHTSTTLTYLVNALVWVCAALFALSNLGFNVSSMLAGLGIGGIAVALAAQAVLGDLFAAVAIYLDRPFVIGDTIKFGDNVGTISSIGFKTTRLKALSGELLVVPNSALASATIQNFRYLRERRVVAAFNAAYGTPTATLAALPAEIAALIEKAGEPGLVRVERVHFSAMSAFSLDFEAVYFVVSPDYNVFMDVKQRANLAVLDHMARRGVEIPFPTQTVHLAKS